MMALEQDVMVLKARMRLLEAIVKPLVAMASNDLFEAVVEALESPETPEGHPDLALEIDERSQQLAYELRAFRGGLIDRGWKPA